MCRVGAIIGDLGAAASLVERMRAIAVVNPHGNGIGGFVDGAPLLRRSAASALDDPGFGLAGFPQHGTVLLHERYATVGATRPENSHPFLIGPPGDELLFAQNGTIGGVDLLDAARGADLAQYRLGGQTDSERYGALLHAESRRAGGVVEGYRQLVPYLAEHQPMTSINSVTTDRSGDLWALRYPENRTLWVHRAGAREAADGQRLLDAEQPGAFTMVSSQPLGPREGWELIPPGQVLHVRRGDLAETFHQVADGPPRRRLDDDHVDQGTVWNDGWAPPAHWRRSPWPEDPAELAAALAQAEA